MIYWMIYHGQIVKLTLSNHLFKMRSQHIIAVFDNTYFFEGDIDTCKYPYLFKIKKIKFNARTKLVQQENAFCYCSFADAYFATAFEPQYLETLIAQYIKSSQNYLSIETRELSSHISDRHIRPNNRKYKTYLVKYQDKYKIGKTEDVSRRMCELQLQYPGCSLIGFSDKDIEKQLHIRYAHLNAGGEFFTLSNKEVVEILTQYQFNLIDTT